MGFLTVGRRFLLDQNEIIDDRIDVVSRGLLGLTVTCARCHDHKFDPIPTEDYYSLYGVFASSVEPAELPLLGRPGDPARVGRLRAEAGGGHTSTRRLPGGPARRIHGGLAKPVSPSILKAAHELQFDPENSKLEECGLAAKLNTRRLRSVITLWKRHLEATIKVNDPVSVPGMPLPVCPKDQFAARASELQRKLTGPNDAKATASPPAGRQVRARQSAREHGRGRRAVCDSFRPARGTLEREFREVAAPTGTARARLGVAPAGTLRPERIAPRCRRTRCESFSIKNKPDSSIS